MQTIVNTNADEASKLAHELAQGYYSYAAALTVLKDPRIDQLVPNLENGQIVPIGRVSSKNGVQYHTYHFRFYLEELRKNPFMVDQMEKIWFAGALLTLGDKLAKHKYFDRSAVLELIRYLRNGVAHGNKFRIDKHKDLVKYPANNKEAVEGNNGLLCEIVPALNGNNVLFDFIGPGDIVTLFTSVSFHLTKIANGGIVI